MPLLVAFLCAVALLPWSTGVSPATALLVQTLLTAGVLALAWIWGKGRRLATLPSLAALPLFAVGHTTAVALLPLGAGMAMGRITPPRSPTLAASAMLGTLGVAACILPNTIVPPAVAAGLTLFLLAAAFQPKAGLLAAAMAGVGAGLAWGIVGQGSATVVAGLAVGGTLVGLRPGWRHGLTAAGALAVGGLAGTAVGGWTNTDPMTLLVAGAGGLVMAWMAGASGRTSVAAVVALALAAPIPTALWAVPALVVAGSWGARLRPRLAPFAQPPHAASAVPHPTRREPAPPRPISAPPTVPLSLEAAA